MYRVVGLAVLALAACAEEPTEQDRQVAVAEVEAHREPPPEELEPQPIGYPDIEANDLYGAGCNFVPEGGGMGAIALAQAEKGYLKRGGEVLTFAADKGSRELPYLARREYDGLSYSFTMEVNEQSGEQSGYETTDYRGRLTVFDKQDRVVYRAPGLIQCGA